MSQLDHDEAIEKMLREAQTDLAAAEVPHWRRVIANDCRDGEGDIIVVPTRVRVRLPPPKYLVRDHGEQGWSWVAEDEEVHAIVGEDAERRAYLAAWAHYDQTHGRRGPTDG